MGNIIYWALIRFAVTIPIAWFLSGYIESRFYTVAAIGLIYLIALHPAIIQYKKFINRTKSIVEDTLCSKCKHFDETAVLCMKYDEHPTMNYIPCEGVHWEPK